MRNLSKTMLAVLATGLLSCGLFCQKAHAFNGSVEFFGSARASGNSGGGTTTIFFTNPWSVIAGDGAYTGSVGSAALMTDFSFTGTGNGAALSLPGGVIPEWSFSFNNGSGNHTYTFDLLALIDGTTTSGGMSLSGTGLAYIDGADPTFATWALQGSGTGFKFKFSSSTTTAVPDGGSAVALLGIAFAGIEIARRKIKAKTA
jgi:VPDSG-CTERM motif